LTVGDATHLPEIHTMAADGSSLERLSHFNDAFLDSVSLSVPETIVARNGAGDDVESWLYPPLSLDPARKYPLILYIHGGPQEYDGDFFDTGLENQVFPGAGYAVLRVNYRGSTSYGERFCRAPWGDWHSREYEDLMAALDRALADRPWLDAGRLGIGGWSYGGIMTLWAVGHTDRFKVGVPERFSFDYRSTFGEDQWHTQSLEELGNPMTEDEKYRRLSPGTYLPNVKTPLYLIADQKDLNCPLPQVMQAYQRLRLMGQKTELVVYPDEPHSMGRTSHLVDRLERLLHWYGAHLAP
jgi:dipeptidyl aminopeptidase/acylaminoacyl peptidase